MCVYYYYYYLQVDPNIFREFVLWRENPNLEKDNPFVTHMYREDIDQCLDFSNTALVAEVKKAIDTENIFIEAVDKAKSHFPKLVIKYLYMNFKVRL